MLALSATGRAHPLSHRGPDAVLPAGEYFPEVTAFASGSHLSCFAGRAEVFALTFRVSDTVIPEPATGFS